MTTLREPPAKNPRTARAPSRLLPVHGSRPRHRAIVAVDIEASTARTNPAKALQRRVTYELLGRALKAAGVAAGHCDPMVDRGDGVLVLVRPVDEAPKTVLLDPLIPALRTLLAEHNAQRTVRDRPEWRLRLRMVVHAGEVHFDGNGHFGEALDIAFRLLDAPALKRRLRAVEESLVVVVSDEIFEHVVRHGYPGIRCEEYLPLVRVVVAGRTRRGWVRTPREEPPPSPA